jgi:flagellar basal-body rod protein FlgF
MIYGMYLSGQGAEAQALRQSVVANNLANGSTTAFKPEVALFKSHLPFDTLLGNAVAGPPGWEQQTGGVTLEGTATDYSQGSLKQTGGPLDVALAGDGFFQVNAGGQKLLTRTGRFSLNPDGEIVMSDMGHPVLGVDGLPIVVPPGMSNIEVSVDGAVTVTDPGGQRLGLGQFALVNPETLTQLMKAGDGLYEPNGKLQTERADGQVRQGFVEESNTNPMLSTIELIESSRGFETNLNLIRHQDEMLGRLLQSIPRR